MHINGPSQVHGPQAINAPHFTQRTQGSQAASGAASTDRVEISQAAEAAMKATDAGGVRTRTGKPDPQPNRRRHLRHAR